MPLPHTGNHEFVLCICESAYFMLNSVVYCIFLDSTYKQYHIVFIFLCLTYFTWHNALQAHLCCCQWQYIILFYGCVLFHCVCARACMYVCVSHLHVSVCTYCPGKFFSCTLYDSKKYLVLDKFFLVPLIMRFMGVSIWFCLAHWYWMNVCWMNETFILISFYASPLTING